MPTSNSDSTMTSTSTHKEGRFLDELAEFKEELKKKNFMEEKIEELEIKFGQEQVGALLHSSAHHRL